MGVVFSDPFTSSRDSPALGLDQLSPVDCRICEEDCFLQSSSGVDLAGTKGCCTVGMLYFRVVLRVLRTTADCVVGLMAWATVEVPRSSTRAKVDVTRTCGIRVAVGHNDESPLHSRTLVLDCYRDADHIHIACKMLQIGMFAAHVYVGESCRLALNSATAPTERSAWTLVSLQTDAS